MKLLSSLIGILVLLSLPFRTEAQTTDTLYGRVKAQVEEEAQTGKAELPVQRFQRGNHTGIRAGGLEEPPPVNRKVQRLGGRELLVFSLAEAPLEKLSHSVSHVASDPRVGKRGTSTPLEELVHRSGDVLPRIHEGPVEIENDEIHAAMPVEPAHAI